MSTEIVTLDNSREKLDALHKRLWEIPFDNSQFQNENFVLNAALTPERAYRSAALKLQNKLNALIEVGFQKRRDVIKVKQLQRKLEVEKDDLEQELIQIDIDEIEAKSFHTDKLIHDAIVEANQMLEFINSHPGYTREDFEEAERGHFEKRLLQEAQGVTGAIKSLVDMGVKLEMVSQSKGE